MIAPGFTGSRLDRADALRHDPAGVEVARRNPAARLLVLDAYEPRVGEDGELAWTTLDDLPVDAETLLLGLDEGEPRFAAITGERPPPGRSPALLESLDRLRPDQAAIYAAARSVLNWHATHRFCANCSAASEVFRAGWGRKCPACGTEHFPRVDPVVIMIAEHDGRALLGRQPSWPPRRYSALAGFLEPGESVEEAVAREIREETGVEVDDVRYLASQPWPFPHAQLMIACVAMARGDAITLDRHELEDAIWVSREEVCAVLAGAPGPFLPPPPYAIAHTLLSRWSRLS